MQEKGLQKTALLYHDKPPEIEYNPKLEQWYSYALDKIGTTNLKPTHVDNNMIKKYLKNVFTVTFYDKGMEQINLNRTLKP